MGILEWILISIFIGYVALSMILFPFLLFRCIQYLNFIKNDEYYDYERWLNDIKKGKRR